jgi:hypothetical protein
MAACSLAAGLLAGSAQGSEVVAPGGKLTPVGPGIAVLCQSRDAAHFKGYTVAKATTPYVVSLSWELDPPESVLLRFSEDATSRLLLQTSGGPLSPKAVGTDFPPPPPPGKKQLPTDFWGPVSGAMLHKDGGRFMLMSPVGAREFLFELPTGSVAQAFRFEAGIVGKEYTIRCEMAR